MATSPVPMEQTGDKTKKSSVKETLGTQDDVLARLRKDLALLEVAVLRKELRLIARVLRSTACIRKQLNADVLSQIIQEQFANKPSAYEGSKNQLLEYLSESKSRSNGNGFSMEVDTPGTTKNKTDGGYGSSETLLPEVIGFLHLLVCVYLLDQGRRQDAISCTTKLVSYLKRFNRRTLDEISSRTYYFWSLAHEKIGQLGSIRESLLSAHATAVLRHDYVGQATLLNLLLRNYIVYRLYDQADKLVSRTKFPETRSNNQLARYFYYLGRIRAIQLDYTESMRCLLQALRKAPQNGALGFRLEAQKFAILVQLLTGEVPDRKIFLQEGMSKSLLPYLQLARAVRIGDLKYFQHVVDKYLNIFEKEGTATLIIRLRQNVIKAGLKRLTVAYSRISIEDIRRSLGLEVARDAEFVIAKAIRDGVIDATIYHSQGYVDSREFTHIYSTTDPQHSFHDRIRFCMDIHNETVRAMRFPEKDKKETETPEERRERLKEEQELAHTLVEEEDEDDIL
eukprot:jgi/Galph1/4999/GphlegSOOS_G3616.1